MGGFDLDEYFTKITSASVEAISIFEYMQELQILQEQESNQLNTLARRTQRISRRMTSDLRDIIAYGTGNVNIKDIVNEVRNLLNCSNGTVETALNVEDEIRGRWLS